MSAQQLCFFKFSRPLIDLLGKDFFKAAPSCPGVYLFRGELSRVLYVGQSRNLRVRLGYYKNAQPEREPRRIIRLVHLTKSIELQACASPVEAQARELELIQEHRPRFNVQHALSRTYSFFGVHHSCDTLRLRLSMEESARPDENFVGAFKNRGLCRRAFFALLRTLRCLCQPVRSVYDFPIGFMDTARLTDQQVSAQPGDVSAVLDLIKGRSLEFAGRTESLSAAAADASLKALFENDLIVMTEFFALASRMRELRERIGTDGLLPQKQVDRVRFVAPNPTVAPAS